MEVAAAPVNTAPFNPLDGPVAAPPPAAPQSPLDGAPATPAPAPAPPTPTDLAALPLPPHIAQQAGELQSDRRLQVAPRDLDRWGPPGLRLLEPLPEHSPGSLLRDNRAPSPPPGDLQLAEMRQISAPTPVAAAAAEVAANAPAAPKAEPIELAALELLLADPANREMVKHFGGDLKPLPTWTSVGKGIEARYGQDLGARLYQLQNAQRAVEGEFFQAMDQVQQNAPKTPLPQLRHGQPEPTTDQPGWRYNAGSGHWDGDGPSWQFDPGAFARHYAAGDSPAQKAFASLHGSEPLKFVRAPDMDGAGPDSWQLGGLALRQGRPVGNDEGLTPDAFHVNDHGWVKWGAPRPDHHLDPDHITKLNNTEFVWFDPVHGFSTDPGNIKGDWLDRAFPYVFAAAITAMTFGAGSTVAAGIASAAGGGTAGSIAVGAATGAVSNAALQLAANGKISFGQLLQSALAGGATAGISQIPGVGQYLDGKAASLGQRLMEYTGRATVQGAIQAVMGGKFRDGMVNSLIGSLAGEVTAQLDAQIGQMRGLNPSEASALRLLTRATGSALRVAGSNDPAAGFASDFLSGVIGDGLASHRPAGGGADPQPTSGSQGSGDSQYHLDVGDDGLGLRPGRGQGVRWDGLRSQNPPEYGAPDESRPIYDFDPDGRWDPDAPASIDFVDRPIAQLAPPVNPAVAGGGVVGGGYQATRPAGAGGPPGYDPLYDLPIGAPGYSPANPGLGIKVPPFEELVPPWINNLILGPAIVGSSWAQYLIDRRASGILADNLEATGIVRPADTAAHHIITYGDGRSAYLRDKFRDWGIDINSPENGVFLPDKPNSAAPGSYHPRLNNDDYHNQIRLDFTGVSSRQEALDVLRQIREQLLNGTYPGSRPRPEKRP